ncbi:hypothetical protein E0W80_07585 [Microbacterium sp. PI-1]|uniref:PseG/SpsG family protein n=1 Tax=Microbacterium sp. PI-1 TaxID=2545631 RepID=UPI00103E7AFB|nr:hypothetical protein [Microbacterium sp. PI-1]TCJ27963.1 hypothetical protein E0W80_07585 [Microbacterium sp. PI-1]
MRCLIRADATFETGTGHVMRCLTLAEELRARGHEVLLRGELGGITWLIERVAEAGVRHEHVQAHDLAWADEDAYSFDVVVVDSYVIDVDSVNAMARVTPTLAIVDADHRGLIVDLYLDQNLGAADFPWEHSLIGAPFALVRADIVRLKRDRLRPLTSPPQVLSFMGGSDPTGAIVTVTRELLSLPMPVEVTLVVAPRWQDDVDALIADRPGFRSLAPTPALPELLAGADVVVSATGTSAWEICTIGVPSMFIAVVDNQRPGLRALVEGGLSLGIDLTDLPAPPGTAPEIAHGVERLITEESLRERLFSACNHVFDGQGARRVAAALEDIARSGR